MEVLVLVSHYNSNLAIGILIENNYEVLIENIKLEDI